MIHKGIMIGLASILATFLGCSDGHDHFVDSGDTDTAEAEPGTGGTDAGTDASQKADATVDEDSQVDGRRGQAITLRVAAVQMESKNGDISGNLEHATELVEQAAEKGAELILLPEFMPTGYIWAPEVWDAAESANGPTVQWLKQTAQRLGVWIGTSFLEAAGEDFFNTFVLVAPSSEEAGRVRKQTPATYEAYYFRGEGGTHIIETELGRIGVGICYENIHCFLGELLFEGSANLYLAPFSSPAIPGLDVSEAPLFELGVPTVMVNKVGEFSSPLPPNMTTVFEGQFFGTSTIADSDMSIKARMNDSDEGVIVETVFLDPARKVTEKPVCEGRFHPYYAPIFEPLSVEQIEEEGRQWYESSSERKEKALSISSE